MSNTDSKYNQAERAVIAANNILRQKGFADIVPVGVIEMTNDEIDNAYVKDKKDWVGRYLLNSVDKNCGLTILLATEKHESVDEMVDTILHETGHGVWELIDWKSQKEWIEAAKDEPNGPLEAFADHMMNVCLGRYQFAPLKELFLKITKLSE